MNRIDRLSSILIMLQSSSFVSPKQITERFGIGMRTVYRDIRALEESGVPITGDSRTGYSLVEGYKLPPLMFTREEAVAFLTAEKLVEQFTDAGLFADYRSGINKIRAVMRIAEKEDVYNAENKIGTLDFHSTTSQVPRNYLQLLMDAACNRKKIEITYFSHSSNSNSVRIVEPIGVFFSVANWYLTAYCNERNDYRTFKISRIAHIRMTDIIMDKPHPPLDTLLRKPDMEDGLQDVILRVRKDDFKIIDETKYANGLTEEKISDDFVELHFRVFSLPRFARWYLSYIDIASVVLPDELPLICQNILRKAKDK